MSRHLLLLAGLACSLLSFGQDEAILVDNVTLIDGNGALACRGLDAFGTLEVGKDADMVLLDANPLADIRNIRRQVMVMARGKIIDTDSLPRQRIFYTPATYPD